MADSSKKGKVTLKDIALHTGYSVNTVSRALREMADISAETRGTIKEAATAMGYVINSIASSLRLGYTRTIAVIVPDVSNPTFSIMMKWIESTARHHGYATFVINTNEDDLLEREAIVSALNKKVDGILLCPAQRNKRNIELLMGLDMPFVLIGRCFDDLHTSSVVCDDLKGGHLATKFLLEQGHRRILAISGPKHVSSARYRLEGYKKALHEAGVKPDPALIYRVSATADGCKAVMEKILQSGIEFSAVFAFSDLIAWGIWSFLRGHGRAVPDACSLIGFDNIHSHLVLPFGLDSIHASYEQMSKRAVEILLQLMRNEIPRSRCISEVMDVQLVSTGTVAAYAQQTK